jgi:hypothetical protein
MNSTDQLYSKIGEYLDRRRSLRDLESWLAPRLPVYLDSPASAIGQTAGAVELLLSELADGIRTERSLRMALKRYVASQSVRWFEHLEHATEDLTSSSAAHLTTGEMLNPSPSWRIEFQGAAA